jgi:hypothetical protein
MNLREISCSDVNMIELIQSMIQRQTFVNTEMLL